MKKFLKKFKCAYFFGPKKIKIMDKKINRMDDIFLIIKVQSCMICGSDIRIYKEGSDRIKKPTIVGHETSGKVVFSKLKKFKIGNKVSLGADFEKENNLAFGYEIDGGFSEYIFLKKKYALRAPIAIFKKNGITAIECIDKKFDPNFHQAMLEVENSSKEPGTVVQEIQKGYMMKKRLLRPSLVGVSKKTQEKGQK